jgi:hypothetical protein
MQPPEILIAWLELSCDHLTAFLVIRRISEHPRGPLEFRKHHTARLDDGYVQRHHGIQQWRRALCAAPAVGRWARP